MKNINIWPEEIISSDDCLKVAATIEHTDNSRETLWYQFPSCFQESVTSSCDPFLVACIFLAMKTHSNIIFHGQVSPTLIENLTEFQEIWRCWCPDEYGLININGEIERDLENNSDKAISCFSAGVDSCFTAFRHKKGLCGKLQKNIQAGLFVQGLDIKLDSKEALQESSQKCRTLLNSLDMDLITVSTNLRQLLEKWKLPWSHTFGISAISCLHLFGRGFRFGLVPSSCPYQSLVQPLASHPLTDLFLSSKSFQIIHDGAAYLRHQKIKEIANWPEVLDNLRVCWKNENHLNCGKCQKCIRTILGFRAHNIDLPPCFEEDVTNWEILTMEYGITEEFKEIVDLAKSKHIDSAWVKCIEFNILFYKIYFKLKSPFK